MLLRLVINYTDLEQPPAPPKPVKPFFIEADDLNDATKQVKAIFAFGNNSLLFKDATAKIQDAATNEVLKTMEYQRHF